MYLKDIAPSNALPELLNYSAPLSEQAQKVVKEIEELKKKSIEANKTNQYGLLTSINKDLASKREELKQLTANLTPQFSTKTYNERLTNQYNYSYSPSTATGSTSDDTIYGFPKMYVYGAGAVVGLGLIYLLTRR
jgi:hypothetical protein